MKLSIIILLLFLIILGISIIYFITDLHKYQRFNGYVKLLGSMVIIFTILTIFIQVKSGIEKQTSDSIFFFSNLTKQLIDETNILFMKNRDLDYYYVELMSLGKIDIKGRDKLKETQITMIIFSRCASILYYIEKNRDNKIVDKKTIEDLEDRFKNILGRFFQSRIFRENWYVYNKSFCGKRFRLYIKNNFSNYVDT